MRRDKRMPRRGKGTMRWSQGLEPRSSPRRSEKRSICWAALAALRIGTCPKPESNGRRLARVSPRLFRGAPTLPTVEVSNLTIAGIAPSGPGIDGSGRRYRWCDSPMSRRLVYRKRQTSRDNGSRKGEIAGANMGTVTKCGAMGPTCQNGSHEGRVAVGQDDHSSMMGVS